MEQSDENLRGFADLSVSTTEARDAAYESAGTTASPAPAAAVPPSERFAALDGDAFRATFGMDRAAFDALPKWKQTALKKQHGLF